MPAGCTLLTPDLYIVTSITTTAPLTETCMLFSSGPRLLLASQHPAVGGISLSLEISVPLILNTFILCLTQLRFKSTIVKGKSFVTTKDSGSDTIMSLLLRMMGQAPCLHDLIEVYIEPLVVMHTMKEKVTFHIWRKNFFLYLFIYLFNIYIGV